MNQDIFLKFSIFLSYVSARLTKKFWPLLNQPASYGPFQPKLWWPLGTVFVEIFWNGKNWGGFTPFPVTHWKEIWISWKKRRFEIFRTLASPSHNNVHVLMIKTYLVGKSLAVLLNNQNAKLYGHKSRKNSELEFWMTSLAVHNRFLFLFSLQIM